MPDALSMSVTGFDELDKALMELEPKLGKKILTQAMRKSLKPVKKSVEHHAPVGEGPGEHGSIEDAVKIRSGPRKKHSASLEIQIGDQPGSQSNVYWGAHVEYGTSKQPGQHYMLRAFDETKAAALDELAKGILAGLDKLVAESAR